MHIRKQVPGHFTLDPVYNDFGASEVLAWNKTVNLQLDSDNRVERVMLLAGFYDCSDDSGPCARSRRRARGFNFEFSSAAPSGE
jgi:hypothetical protein